MRCSLYISSAINFSCLSRCFRYRQHFFFSSLLLVYLIDFAENDENSDQPCHRFFRLGHIFANYSPSFNIPSFSQVINTMRHPAQDRYSTDPDFITRGKTGHTEYQKCKKLCLCYLERRLFENVYTRMQCLLLSK